MSREERKAEQALKALLKLPANKRCINCDSLGPQYVVSAFNVFVCTVCSGVHRQFGHRVKGVSMSTFKADEVAMLSESGNEKFAAFFLSKWTMGALPKPVDRDVSRIHAWIAAVYQQRRFYAEPAGGWTAGASDGAALAPTRSTAGSTAASEASEPAMRPLHEVLGSDTPKLQVQHSGSVGGSGRQLDRTTSAASSSAGAVTPTRSATMPAASSSSTGAAAGAAARELNLMDVSSPKSAKSAPPGAVPQAAATTATAWDPFGASSPTAAAAPAPSSSAAESPGAAESGWASFGDAPAPAAAALPAQKPAPASVAPAPAAAVAPAAEGGSANGGWEAFGEGAASAEPAAPSQAAAPAAPAAPAAGAPASGSPPKAAAPRQAVHSSTRPEVPMDIFFPEFEQIRATGMLPNGQPVPLPSFPHSYGGRGGVPPQQHPKPGQGANPYAAYGLAAAAQQQQQHPHPAAAAYGGGYGAAAAPQRPTIAIPPAPLHPGGGYYAGMSPSPGGYPGGYPGMPSPGPGPYSSPSAYSPAGSLTSPAGSGFSAASQPPANGGYSGFAADLRSSTGSLGDVMPGGSAAPTPAGHRMGDPAAANDPFAGLAPGLRAALPAVPAAGGGGCGSAKWGSAAPPPTPAGAPAPPPYATGSGAPVGMPAYPAAGPFAVAGAPSPAGLAPATAAASATLFGRAPSLTGYDMSAPAAPKPQASGNPFA